MALIKCKECGEQVSNQASQCPKCGAQIKRKTSFFTGCLTVILIFFGAMFVFLGVFGNSPSQESVSARDGLSSAIWEAKKAVRGSLKDPDSADFGRVVAMKNPQGGWVVCGFVNAKNPFGGYTGNKLFVFSKGELAMQESVQKASTETQVQFAAVAKTCFENGSP